MTVTILFNKYHQIFIIDKLLICLNSDFFVGNCQTITYKKLHCMIYLIAHKIKRYLLCYFSIFIPIQFNQ